MYKGKTISVAMATYNGEKNIEEQIVSICSNQVKPDEIIISDDGSSDKTLEVVHRTIRSMDTSGIHFVVLTDNANHGYAGNFAWALMHSTGDVVFLSDQDDIWTDNKIQSIMDVFHKYPDANLVFHDARIFYDNTNEWLDDVFNQFLNTKAMHFNDDDVAKVCRDQFLSDAATLTIAQGMVIAAKREFVQSSLPLPRGAAQDNWLTFRAVCLDTCYYLNQSLTAYRLHDNNVAGRKGQRRSVFVKAHRVLRRLSKIADVVGYHEYICSMIKEMEANGLESSKAFRDLTACKEISDELLSAFRSTRASGAYKVIHLYFTNNRYHNSGREQFIHQLWSVVRFGKKDRAYFLKEYKNG